MVNKKRLSLLAELLKGYDVALDIGTDHGFVLKEAIDKGYIKKGIASDIGEGPLKQAKKNLKNYPIDFVLSNGFEDIHSPYDIVIIAGMGVYTIRDILEQDHERKTYLLQANDKYEILRSYLSEHHFKIIDEYLIHDKFFYIVMKVVPGEMMLSDEDLYLGPVLKHKAEAKPYYQYQIDKLTDICKVADKKTVDKHMQTIQYYKRYV